MIGLPPDSRKARPRQETGHQLTPQTSTGNVADLGAQLRRRREASWRLPSLADDRRDPLDALAHLPVLHAARCCGAEFTAAGVRPCCREGAA